MQLTEVRGSAGSGHETDGACRRKTKAAVDGGKDGGYTGYQRTDGDRTGGGGASGAVNFVWGISRFKLAAKFPTQIAGCSGKLAPMAKLHRGCKARHTTTFLGVSGNFAAQNPGAFAKISATKLTTANLTWHEPPPPRPPASVEHHSTSLPPHSPPRPPTLADTRDVIERVTTTGGGGVSPPLEPPPPWNQIS